MDAEVRIRQLMVNPFWRLHLTRVLDADAVHGRLRFTGKMQ